MSTTKGFVYFAPKDGLLKIGFSTHPQRRARELKPDGPLKLIVGTSDIEKELHQRFNVQRVTGEWFKNEGDLKQFVDALELLLDTGPWQRTRNKPRKTKQSSGWMRR